MGKRLNKHSLQLSEIALQDLEVKCTTVQLTETTSTAQTVQLQVNTSGEVFSSTEGYAVLRVSVGFEESDTAPFSILVTYRGKVVSDTAIEESKFEAFLREQGFYLIWPYLRQLVSELTVHMGYPPLVLPTLAHTKDLVEAGEDTHDDNQSNLQDS